jgi:two-component system, NarL family, nitrate/nitrite response regulator NarL
MARVLIVDDDLDVRRQLCRCLSEKGAVVQCAYDVACGIEMLELRGPFDLVVVDFNLPDDDGDKVIKRARDCYPNACIVSVSTSEREFIWLFVKTAGANLFYRKPLSDRDLDAICNLISS